MVLSRTDEWVKNRLRCNHIKIDDSLTSVVRSFIKIDSFGTKPDVSIPTSREEKRAWEILRQTTKHNGERYEAGLLWRADEVKMETNHSMAMTRLTSLERKFKRDRSLADQYSKVINEYVRLKHARKLSIAEVNDARSGRVRYNPHQPE